MNITKELVTLPFEDIKAYSRNPRVISQEAVDQCMSSIRNYGYICDIVVEENNIIMAGHTRYVSLGLLKYDNVEVVRVSGLTDAQKKAFRIADNKVSEFSDWDEGVLIAELMELNELGDLMQELNTAFLADELATLIGEEDYPPPPDDPPDPKTCPKCGAEL